MARKSNTFQQLECDRCKAVHSYNVEEGQSSIAKWSKWNVQGQNPTSIINLGDGYTFDLCPDCTEIGAKWLNDRF